MKMNLTLLAAVVAPGWVLINGEKRQLRGGEAKELPNVGAVLQGINILEFSPFAESSGSRREIFQLTYEKGNTRYGFKIPDGITMSDGLDCSITSATSQINGEQSLMKSQEKEISAEASASYMGIEGSLKNSDTFRSMSQEMSSQNSYFLQSEMMCKVYKVQVHDWDQPKFSETFARGVVAFARVIKQQNTAEISKQAQDFVDSFGTHYHRGASFGSKYTRTWEASSSTLQTLKSSSVDIDVAASVTALKLSGASAKASVHTASEEAQGNYFSSVLTKSTEHTMGTLPPQGSTAEEIKRNWLEATKKSKQLAPVGDWSFEPLHSLFKDGNLDEINQAISSFTDYPKLTAAHLNQMKTALVVAIQGFCRQHGGLDCSKETHDKPNPLPFRVQSAATKWVEWNGWNDPHYSIDVDQAAGLFGQPHGVFDIMPTKFRVYLAATDVEKLGYRIIAGLQVEYTNARGEKRDSRVFGKDNNDDTKVCEIDIPYGERLTRAVIRRGARIDYIQFGTDKKWFSGCGNAQGGEPTSFNLPAGGKQYFLGVFGRENPMSIDAVGLTYAIAK